MKFPAQAFFSSPLFRFLFLAVILTVAVPSYGQEEPPVSDSTEIYQVVKNDGAQFVGRIIRRDERELVIETKDRGRILIPMHEIKSIKLIPKKEVSKNGDYETTNFSKHYLLFTSAVPEKKDESYIVISWYGVDYHMAVTDRIGIGLTSTWWGSPMLGTVKYSVPLSKNVSFTLGGIIGSGTWVWPDLVLGVPYAGIGLGSKNINVSMSYGYGCFFDGEQATQYRPAFSFGGCANLTKTFSLVFDSLILPATETSTDWAGSPTTNALTVVSPSFRWHLKNRNALQAGMCGVYIGNGSDVFAFPTIQYIRKIE